MIRLETARHTPAGGGEDVSGNAGSRRVPGAPSQCNVLERA